MLIIRGISRICSYIPAGFCAPAQPLCWSATWGTALGAAFAAASRASVGASWGALPAASLVYLVVPFGFHENHRGAGGHERRRHEERQRNEIEQRRPDPEPDG